MGGHLGFALGEAVLVGLLVLLLTDKSVTCLTIGPEHVTKEQSDIVNTLYYSDIKGFSEHTTKEGTYTRLEALPTAGKDIVVEAKYAAYREIRALLAAHVPDLDEPARTRHLLARAQATDKLLQDSKLGPTTQARSSALRRSQGFTFWLNVAAILLAVWAAFFPHPLELVAGLALAVPLAAVAALWAGRGLAQFMPNTDDPHSNMLTAIAAPTLPLLFHLVIDYSFFSWRPLWPAAASIGLGFGALLLLGGRRGLAQSTRLLVVLPVALGLAAAYGLVAATAYNVAGGGQRAGRYVVHVNDKSISTGKHSYCYLFTTPWGPADAPTTFQVSPTYYKRKQRGDTVSVRLHKGRLGADWASGPEDE